MEGFLYNIATDLYSRYGTEVGRLKMLFPSRRARLFFADSLASIAQQPILEPEWGAIDELMGRIAGVEVGDRVRLIAELYNIYVKHHPNESFDRFYYWGEILLGDFDMVDKYLIDPDRLFRNIADIKELESDISYLTPQEQRIVAFWSSIGAEEDLSEHKRRFLKVWQSLAPIYHQYHARLSELGFGYSGMVHRRAAERIRSGEYSVDGSDRYVVAGFNALSECEKVLFTELKNGATTHFYWDWDEYYSENERQEAGLFINNNRLKFPAAAEFPIDNFAKEKQMSVVACSSSALQCKYVANLLDEIVQSGGVIDKRTAIVLTDESLLLPLLYSLPKYVGKVNVTMGYPLRQSLAYSFVERLLELQHHARSSGTTGRESLYYVDVQGILSHPYLEAGVEEDLRRGIISKIRSERLISVDLETLGCNELLKRVFRRVEGWRGISLYLSEVIGMVAQLPHRSDSDGEQRVEFLSFIADQIATLHNSVEQCGIELSTTTYLSLLRRHLQPLRIPFEGEPLEGLQVMGILETRTLDFDNIIMLSMSDDNFPGSRVQQPSFVPYNLRAAYGLPTPEHHDGVYAYYFYRLIQRSKKLWMLYCSCADDKSTGEQSRYITQLDYESPFELGRLDVGVDVNLFDGDEMVVSKEGRVAEQLARFKGAKGGDLVQLSPTALARYIACPMQFYFYSLARIKSSDELTEDIDAPMFGTILHDAMQRLYAPLTECENTALELSKMDLQRVYREVDRAIRVNYLRCDADDEKTPLSGNLLIVREVVAKYIKDGILRYDGAEANSSFRVLGVEDEVEHYMALRSGEFVRLCGICDRVDKMPNGAQRVVDYKSGAEHLAFDGIENLFNGDGKQRLANIFQTLLYSYMLRQESGCEMAITPSLYYVRKMNRDDYSPLLLCCEGEGRNKSLTPVESYESYHESFEQQLQQLLEELFDLDRPFVQCVDTKNTCAYCDYRSICRKCD